jgi:hypothetical protein
VETPVWGRGPKSGPIQGELGSQVVLFLEDPIDPCLTRQELRRGGRILHPFSCYVLTTRTPRGHEERKRRSVDEAATFTIPPSLDLRTAAAALLARPEENRYQDLLVPASGEPCIVPVLEVFEGLPDTGPP